MSATDPLTTLLAQVDKDLDALFAPLRSDIDRYLAEAKPNVTALERRINGRLGSMFGFREADFPDSPLGRYFQGALAAAHATATGTKTLIPLDRQNQGGTVTERAWAGARNLRDMLVANIKHFSGLKASGPTTKDDVRGWFTSFLTTQGSGKALGTNGDHGLYQLRRLLHTEATREYGIGIRAVALTKGQAVRWRVSAFHVDQDQCDTNATQDLHGLGPGVYPANVVPRFPNHPHCKCRLEVV